MDPFPEDTAFAADPALPSAADLADDLAVDELDTDAFAQAEDSAAPAPAPVVMSGAAPAGLPLFAPEPETSGPSEAFTRWQEEHTQMLVDRSKDESERRQAGLAKAAADLETFNAERAARIEAKRKQNADEEAQFRETQKKIMEEGKDWQQAAKLIEQAGKVPGSSQSKDNDQDTARMRSLLLNLKQ